jgi:phosphatidylglycerol---prolipoprotein diacylglyceryl transferase
MVPALPFGPITLPTGPIFALLAAYLGIDTAVRAGRRFALQADDVWNIGLLAVLAGVIVARLWNVIQFWYVYAPEPQLIFSLRPSGFAFWPGVVAAVVAGYVYLLWRALDPMKVAAAFAAGVLAASAVLGVGDFLTGVVTGVPSDLPWALPYYGEMQHAVGLYRAIGFIIALVVVLATLDPKRPWRTVLIAGMGYGLVRLVADGFIANASTIGPLRISQVVGLGLALACTALLANDERRAATQVVEPQVPLPVEDGIADQAN